MEINEISLFFNYYETNIYKTQYEKTFQNGGYIKIPFKNNRGLTEPNLIISDQNTKVTYRTENIYIFNNIHKIEGKLKSKNKILPESNDDEEGTFANGELVIEHVPITNGREKVYTVFLLSSFEEGTPIFHSQTSSSHSNKSIDKNNIIDLIIQNSIVQQESNSYSSSLQKNVNISFM
jgi:hypothetical protein